MKRAGAGADADKRPSKTRRRLGGDITTEMLMAAASDGHIDIDGSKVCTEPLTEEQEHLLKQVSSFRQYLSQEKKKRYAKDETNKDDKGKTTTELRNAQLDARRAVASWFLEHHDSASEPRSVATTYRLPGGYGYITVKTAPKSTEKLTQEIILRVLETMDMDSVMARIKGNVTPAKVIKNFVIQFKQDLSAARIEHTWDALFLAPDKLGKLADVEDELNDAPDALASLVDTWRVAEAVWREADQAKKKAISELTERYDGVEESAIKLLKERKATQQEFPTTNLETKKSCTGAATLKGGGTKPQKLTVGLVEQSIKTAIDGVANIATKCKSEEGFAEIVQELKAALEVQLPLLETVQVAVKETLGFSIDGKATDGTVH